ncbi:MAG TPA: MgtC/SapB family protein [Phycisphaerae bacterium]|nr:MgtC/SapB family protein [Phycisphaerae bacterium]
MSDRLWPYLGDIHEVVPAHWAGVIVTIASVICGGIIGVERQRAQKPAGMRTLILICLGSAIFTQASILLGGDWPGADRTRVAAQIVTGIGFLGAGAIIRERGLVIGVTTGASIWATSAVGVIIGSGHVAAGAFFSLLIYFVLRASKLIDRLALGACQFATLQLEYEPHGCRTRLAIESVMEDHHHFVRMRFDEPPNGPGRASIEYCTVHPDHRPFIPNLLDLPAITRISQG